MNYDGTKYSNFDVKKWLKVLIVTLAGISVIRLIVFSLFLGTLGSFFNNFNQYFVAEQNAIHSKIVNSDTEFKQEVAQFDRGWIPIMFEFEKQKLKKENKWGLQGEEFANNILAEKQEYEAKIAACNKDEQCKYFLKYRK